MANTSPATHYDCVIVHLLNVVGEKEIFCGIDDFVIYSNNWDLSGVSQICIGSYDYLPIPSADPIGFSSESYL